jgi:tripeptidyl-peptidase-1
VVDTFSPPQSTIDAVVSWLLEVGVSEERITISGSRNWIKINSTIIEAETLLKTEYKVYEHKTTGKRSLAVDEYSLPLAVRDHIEFVTPTVRFAELTMKPKVKRSDAVGAGATKGGPPVSSWDLKYCSNYSTPACLRELYNIPNGTLDLSSFGIIDFVPDVSVNPDDKATESWSKLLITNRTLTARKILGNTCRPSVLRFPRAPTHPSN